MAQTLTDDQKGEIKEAFNFFDKDKDGSIDITELNNVMKSLGKNPTDNEMQSLIKGVDSDGDGMINYEEFQNMMAIFIHFLKIPYQYYQETSWCTPAEGQ